MVDESSGMTLSDLADLDVSDIEEVRFTNLPAGIFGWEIKESELKEYEKDETALKFVYDISGASAYLTMAF